MKLLTGIIFISLSILINTAYAQSEANSLRFLPVHSYEYPDHQLSFDIQRLNRQILYRSSWSYLGGFLQNFSAVDPLNWFQAGSIMDMRSFESRNWQEYQFQAERMYFINSLNQKNGLRFY